MVDSVEAKGLRLFDTGGNRQETYEFDVDVDDIRGIGFANGRFFLADIHFNDRKINVYNEDGEHQPDESIDLGFANASGLFAADDGKIYIPGRVGDSLRARIPILARRKGREECSDPNTNWLAGQQLTSHPATACCGQPDTAT